MLKGCLKKKNTANIFFSRDRYRNRYKTLGI